MTDKPTGVFVRLPLSDAQVLELLDAYTGDKKTTNPKMEDAFLAIGTPVEGREPKCDAVLQYDAQDRTLRVVSWNDKPFPNLQYVQVTILSDAQAALAAAQAENVRLREALEGEKTFHEEQDKAICKQPPSAQGQWRRHQHQEQIENIEEALKGGNL